MSTASAWIGLGSNLDDPPAQLRKALDALDGLPLTRLVQASRFYRTAPVGPQDQPDFCNAVARVDTGLSPDTLLEALQAVEAARGRRRGRRWGERTLDLDVLLYADVTSSDRHLTLPHPRLHERAFVLVPLAELDPHLCVPGRGRVASLAAQVRDQAVALWQQA